MGPATAPTLDMLSGSNAHRAIHELRASNPVAWVTALDRWLITDRALVVAALRDADVFTVDDPRFTTAKVVGPSMLSLDGAEHARHRDPFAGPFRRSATLAGLADRTNQLADAIVERLRSDQPVDLRSRLAAPLAAETISYALGLVDTSTDEMLGWYRSLVDAVEALTADGQAATNGDSTQALLALRAAIDETAAAGHGLMAEIGEGGTLTGDELCSNTAVMLFGAIETSEGMTTNALYHLLTEPEALDRVRMDSALIAQAIEESLRLEPAATFVDRYTTRAVELGGVELPAEAAVGLSLAGANRDPAFFPHPDEFDLDRPNSSQHLSFVHGPHACIGMHLARVETAAAIRSLINRFGLVELVDPEQPGPEGLVFRKPPSLLASCHGAPRAA